MHHEKLRAKVNLINNLTKGMPNGPKRRGLFLKRAKAEFELDPSMHRAGNYVSAAKSAGQDLGEVVEDISQKGGLEAKSEALWTIHHLTDRDDKPARAKTLVDFKKSALELADDPTKTECRIEELLKSIQEAEKQGVNVDMKSSMALVLQKDPDFLNKKEAKKWSSIQEMAGKMKEAIGCLSQQAAQKIVPVVQNLTSIARKQGGLEGPETAGI